MPEIKHNFTKGKMNKDLDERLVPNGEYRHAMNIQVSTSEGSNVGTVQNILGNQIVPGQGNYTYQGGTATPLLPTDNSNRVCVGSVADEKNDILYWFITGDDKDIILKLENTPGGGKSITPVLIDVNKDTLKLHPEKLITSINAIDDMLFWTDNANEPKKINIGRCIAGTTAANVQTKLINDSQSIDLSSDIDIEEKHITVLKKSPPTSPIITLESERDPNFTYTGIMQITQPATQSLSSFNVTGTNQTRHDFSTTYIGEELYVNIETDINLESGFTLDWAAGDIILFKEFENNNPPTIPITDYKIKGKILSPDASSTQNSFTDAISEKTINGDFTLTNSNGTKPLGYNWNSSDITYDSVNDRIEIDSVGNTSWIALWATDTMSWDDTTPKTYKVKVELSGVTQGHVALYIVSANTNTSGNNYRWGTGFMTTDGEHSFDITLNQSTTTASNWPSYADKFIITTRGSEFVGNIESISIEDLSVEDACVLFEVIDINGTPPNVETGESELKYAIDRLDQEEKLYEFKFPRFATRYKYEDGEYSAFSPFSEIAFLPGTLDYHPKKGYNLGMTNKIKSIKIKDIDAHIPDDVVSVDILYKEEGSINIYVVDTIKYNDWSSSYEIDSEIVSKVLPSNQLLRPWDNVPRKALTQDIVGNRIVYGNYIQGYDLKNTSNNNYYPDINFSIEENNIVSTTAKSIKSLREYQLGVVFIDKYGRETPVISNNSLSTKLTKTQASKSNKISAKFNNSDYMKDMKYFKFFVKETSGEYYNIAMDRFWDAGDGHAWVSFPSSDRNKIDIDTFLILKKGVETNNLVEEPARYKVIAIENEAPDFIKTKKTLIEEREHIFATNNIFNDTLTNAPLSGRDNFKMNYTPFANSSGADLDLIDDGVLYVEFTKTGEEFTSKRYRINAIDTNFRNQSVLPTAATYSVKLDKVLGEDVEFIEGSSKIIDTTVTRIYKYKVENSAEFDGRFFVKLINDDIFAKNITQNATASSNHRVLSSKKLYYLKSDIATTHSSAITGQDDGSYDDTNVNNTDFGRYACFFRNYKYDNNSATQGFYDSGTFNAIKPLGQYKFGDTNLNPWYTEFLDFTSSGNNGPVTGVITDGWVGSWSYGGGNPAGRSFTKDADDAAGGDKENVWFIDAGSYEGVRWTNGNLHWPMINQSSNTNNGINHTGSNDYSTLNIGIGGIFHDEISDSGDDNIKDFFDIGVGEGNPFYQDSGTKELVSQLSPAKQFIFTEDPNKNIYTIQPTIDYKQLLRYNNTQDPWNSALEKDQEAQLSPNFTRNWILRIKNEDGSWELPWDPTHAVGAGGIGPIVNGLKLAINHSATAAAFTAPQLGVRVSGLSATNTDGTTHDIKVGMILTSHSGGTTGHTDGSEANEDWLVIWKIEPIGNDYNIFLTGYSALLPTLHDLYSNAPSTSGEMIFEQPAMNGYSEYSANRINTNSPDFTIDNPGLKAIGYNIDFIEPIEIEGELPDNPAIFETEPKESTDLDIYYEASGLNPIELTDDTKNIAIPVGSLVEHVGNPSSIEYGTIIDSVVYNWTGITGATGWFIHVTPPDSSSPNNPLVNGQYINIGSKLKITKPDNSTVTVKVNGWETPTNNRTDTIYIDHNLYSLHNKYTLNWFNCYSFGNGVESNRIRDNFNLPYILNGVKASTTLEEGDYKEEHRKHGLIYSGLYNAISGINNLNQFIAAEKITKDVNPIYGSIQKIHTRDSDLVTLCEDKVLKILANKDAVYEADGNPQLTATNRVLGQTVPFSGEYGISKNPESFASENYRVYFTDKVRGAVMRLSRDGLTPISDHGMKDWFRDNLKLNTKLIGSYDDRNDEYNLTLDSTTVTFQENVRGWVSFKSFVPENAISMANDYYTIKGGEIWEHYDESIDRNTFYGSNFTESSIKFLLNDSPEIVKTFNTLNYEGSQSKIEQFTGETIDGITYDTDGQYYNLSPKDGWYVNNMQTDLQNGSIPEFIKKEGKWFNYIKGKDVSVNLATGIIDSVEEDSAEMSFQGIGILQSAGATTVPGCMDSTAFNYNPMANLDDGSCIAVVLGCMVLGNSAYNPNANTDTTPTSCIYYGCTNSTMFNYDPNANTDDGTCTPFIYGCMTSTMFNFNPAANTNAVSATDPTDPCISIIYGCTDPLACNYNASANTNEVSANDSSNPCVPFQQPNCATVGGFTWHSNLVSNLSTAGYPTQLQFTQATSIANSNTRSFTITNPNGSSTTDHAPPLPSTFTLGITSISNGAYTMDWIVDYVDNCINDCSGTTSFTVILGCMDPTAQYYDSTANIDDGSCIAWVPGCMDCGQYWEAVQLSNNPTSTDPNILYCDGISAATTLGAFNFDPLATQDDSSCSYSGGCTDPNSNNYGANVPCTYTQGCMDSAANNFDPLANDPNPIYTQYPQCTYDGCMNPAASNYDPNATAQGNVSCVIPGCYNDSSAINYNCATLLYTTAQTSPCNDGVTVDDGTCIAAINGCTDSTACNYNSAANSDDGSCTYPGCTDPNANNHNPAAGCDDGSCTYTLAAPVISILPAPSTTTGVSGLTLENSSLWSNPIFNRIAVSWPEINGAIGYVIEYKHVNETAWESIDLDQDPQDDVPSGFGYPNEGDYLYILDDTIIPVNSNNLITNTWASGAADPDEYDIRVSQKFDNVTEPSTAQIAGFVHNETTVPGTTISGTSHGANVSNQLNHINFITPVDDSVLNLDLTATPVNKNQVVYENGIEKQTWEITYTWAKLPVPTSTIVFTFKYPNSNVQLLGGPGSVYDTYSQASQQSSGENTWVRTIKIPRYTGAHTITAYLKLGLFNEPTAGTGCHKPPYTATITQSTNNTNDLFYCALTASNSASVSIDTDV